MPTDLNKLKVSLTKHGAHKVAFLLEKFNPDEIITHINGDYKNIKIELAQTKGNLSLDEKYNAPELWKLIKEYEREDIFDITFLAIIFSHHDLIKTMQIAFEKGCIVNRGEVIGGKAYTNFAHIIEEFKLCIEHQPEYVSFDISRIFHKFYLKEIIRQLLTIKLVEAGWDQKNSLIAECLSLQLNSCFGLGQEEFTLWLDSTNDNIIMPSKRAIRNFAQGIRFKVGHNPKLENDVIAKPKNASQIVTLLHNRIQTKVFEILTKEFPDTEIGTEIPSNGGSIDLVQKTTEGFILYEIKTSNNSRANIRQGLSQLLEYAYWKCNIKILKLVIIGPADNDIDSILYLELLRKKFGIPIFYMYYNIVEESLI